MKEGFGVVVGISAFGNSSLLVTIFSKCGDIVCGVVKGGGVNQRKRHIFQGGNVVKYKWFGRVGSVGVLDCEVEKPYSLLLFDNRLCFSVTRVAVFLLHSFFKECNAVTRAVELYVILMDNLLHHFSDIEAVCKTYVEFETQLLLFTGCYQGISGDDFSMLFMYNTKQILVIYKTLLHKEPPLDILHIRSFIGSKL